MTTIIAVPESSAGPPMADSFLQPSYAVSTMTEKWYDLMNR
jgi:hypothetical protein